MDTGATLFPWRHWSTLTYSSTVSIHDFRKNRQSHTRFCAAASKQNSIRVPHQAVIEFVAAATRPLTGDRSLLSATEARREAEEFLAQFTILYPNEALLRLAFRGAAAYQLSWFDAHLWAYAEYYSLEELLSEDFQHDRLYGTVRAVNPFL